MYYIYKIENLKNGKIYIGKTNDIERRMKEHKNNKNNSLIDRAIKKEGIKSFKVTIIEKVKKSKSNEREKYWIKYYNSYFRAEGSNGYNMTKGGDGGSSWNLRKVHIYDKKGNYLKTFESITSLKEELDCRTSIKDGTLILNKYIVKKCDIPQPKIEEYKRKTNAKRILQLDNSKSIIKEYSSISEVSKYGYNRTGVIGCLKGYYKKSGGYYWCYKDNYNTFIPQEEIKAYKGDRIVKLSLDMQILEYYNNCSEAARKNNISSNKLINKALKTKTHFCKNFLWYKESDLVNMSIPR